MGAQIFLVVKPDPLNQSYALLGSLMESPLLVGDLPEAAIFSRSRLAMPEVCPQFNFQQKLGHLYEDALAHLLAASPQIELLVKNLQVQVNRKNTVGELDYLLQLLGSEKIVHLELAVKFYLAVESDEGMFFPGPDARDQYHRKLARLRQHQLVLPKIYREYLPSEYQTKMIETQQLVYGCFFDHFDSPQVAEADFLNTRCRRGRWLRDSEAVHYLGEKNVEQIPKPLWPVPFELLEKFELEEWKPVQKLESCVMVRVAGSCLPYFIVPDGYPDSSR